MPHRHRAMTYRTFSRFSFFLLCYAVIIIIWGAWVRISGSGDGCGTHWPLCHGGIIPQGSFYYRMQTWIEFAHRAKSGLFGVLVLAQTILCFTLFPSRHPLRAFQILALCFTVTEALLGAVLVLGGFVTTDDSIGRLVVISLHLGNTLLLIGSLATVWKFSRATTMSYDISRPDLQSVKQLIRPLAVPFLVILLISVTGAWAALSTTLFPANDLVTAFQADFQSSSHYLVKLRILHPLIATIGVVFLCMNYYSSLGKKIHLIWLQGVMGLMTLAAHSPIWMKLTHLTLAEVVWIALVHCLVGNQTNQLD